MNLIEGASWGVRLFMGREPRAEDFARLEDSHSVEALRSGLLAFDEVSNGLDRVATFSPELEPELDLQEGLRWAFRLALRREASDADIKAHAPHIQSVADLRRVFRSREFESASKDALILADLDVLRQFAPFSTEPPTAGHSFRNFVGSETRVEFLHPRLAWKAGTVEGVTRPSAPSIHGLAEWIGSLRSVLEAQDRIVVMELGAGWGPWLVSCATAARKRGITDIKLIGVEGSEEHFGYLRQHMIDNGFDPAEHDIHHAVVGVEDGVAYFPKLVDPTLDYGANAVFDEGERDAAMARGELEEVRSVSLNGLLERAGRVDLMHIDIQGHEQDVLTASIDSLGRHVHRIIVGTHSRSIDAALLSLFSNRGWYLEHEEPTAVVQTDAGGLHFPNDGEQVWRNPNV